MCSRPRWNLKAEGYSRCVELFEFGNGLRLLTGHEPVNYKADNDGEQQEVHGAEERCLFIHCGLGVGGLGVHVWHVGPLREETQNTAKVRKKKQQYKKQIIDYFFLVINFFLCIWGGTSFSYCSTHHRFHRFRSKTAH